MRSAQLPLAVLAIAGLSVLTVHVQSQCISKNDRFIPVNVELEHYNDFGFGLMKEFEPMLPEQNVFFSPVSIWSVMLLAYLGSAGETAEQLRSVLLLGDKRLTYRLYKNLQLVYQVGDDWDDSFKFESATRIYVNEDLPLRECVKRVLAEEVRIINLRNVDNALKKINGFVQEKTNGLIKDLLTKDSLMDAQMILLNAIYFKGVWKEEFDASNTKVDKFTTNTANKTVTMMRNTGRYNVSSDKDIGLKMLLLPYQGDVFSMYIVMPLTKNETDFSWRLSNANIKNLMSKMSNRTIEVKLPKFTMDVTLKPELPRALKNMGIVDIFDRSASNLTQFVEDVPMYATETIHKAFINVTEKGTEAAGASALVIGNRIGSPKFHCNRPFIFFIFDNDINSVVFLGKYQDP